MVEKFHQKVNVYILGFRQFFEISHTFEMTSKHKRFPY